MSQKIELTFVVGVDQAGSRLDALLAELSGQSRTTVSGWVKDGEVQLLDAKGRGVKAKASSKLLEEMTVQASGTPPRDLTQVEAEQVDGFSIVYQDDDIVVVDKPTGVAAHPSMGWHGPTVVGALKHAGIDIATSGAAERQGIVHRLDVGTSGLMVVTKNERAYSVMKKAFKDRTVTKVYHTLVQGLPDPLKGTIDAPIGRHPGSEWKFAVNEDGKPAITYYEVLEAFGPASLVEVHLETGRTHQIRVHFSALRHPCAGDLTYGADPTMSAHLGLTRQWLHAHRLGFTHPTSGEQVEFESPYTPDLQYALDTLREGNF
ncbi:RluA family pseudouridine synthase [Rothia nasimurium]|uniref:Pseudouridine synthase n=1 Tax=Rothia nasimurium TaxID=85336 RepID=A0A4Y9F5Q5_9MICC|nr:RluA family pseudouridine synthase [Rothia nasimurium]MBF0807436.1 RluA family pseudouridine synthase [Rothia nasimurium]TFU23735.1 RluA family pseudouridine synthase [Rothia nasimurium]